MKTIIASLIILFSLPGLTLADNNKDKAKKPVATKKDSADNKKPGADKAAREAAARKKAVTSKARPRPKSKPRPAVSHEEAHKPAYENYQAVRKILGANFLRAFDEALEVAAPESD